MDQMVHGRVRGLSAAAARTWSRATLSASRPALPFEEAALLEPLSCVVHAQEMARPETAETVLIIGARSRSVCCTCWRCKAAGVREVAVAGRGAKRLEWAGELGADRVIDVAHRRCRGAKSRGSTAASVPTW